MGGPLPSLSLSGEPYISYLQKDKRVKWNLETGTASWRGREGGEGWGYHEGPTCPLVRLRSARGYLLSQKVKPKACMGPAGSPHHLPGYSKARELSMAFQGAVCQMVRAGGTLEANSP